MVYVEMPMVIKAVFFDMGSTLVYDTGLRQNFVEKLYEKLGKNHNVDREKLEKLFNLWDSIPYREGDEEYWDLFRVMLLLKRLGIKPAPRLVNSIYETVVEIWIKSYQIEENATSTIEKLKNCGLKIGIISNAGSYDSVCGELEKANLLDYVDVVIVSQAVIWKKPSPQIFRIALDMVGVEPSEAVHVGDDPIADIEGAKRAGLWTIQKLKKDTEISPFADFVIKKISEIPEVIEKIMGEKLL